MGQLNSQERPLIEKNKQVSSGFCFNREEKQEFENYQRAKQRVKQRKIEPEPRKDKGRGWRREKRVRDIFSRSEVKKGENFFQNNNDEQGGLQNRYKMVIRESEQQMKDRKVNKDGVNEQDQMNKLHKLINSKELIKNQIKPITKSHNRIKNTTLDKNQRFYIHLHYLLLFVQMIPLSVEAKLITILLMALLNLLLLKRKTTDSDQVQSFLVNGANGFNVAGRSQRTDGFHTKRYIESETFNQVRAKGELEEKSGEEKQNDNTQSENKLFVRWFKTKPLSNSHENNQPNQTFFEINPKHSVETKPIQHQIDTPSSPKDAQNQQSNIFSQSPLNAPTPKPQIVVPILQNSMQEQRNSEQLYDIIQQSQSDKQCKKYKNPNKLTNPLFSQRKSCTQKKFPFEPESESDSNSKKTLIKLRFKQKNECKSHCQCCKQSQAPRQTLKRCIQDLIYSTFEEMIEKKTVQQSFGNKKKKRSM